MAPRELGNTKSVIGRGPDNDNDNDNPCRIRGFRKEENQQWGTNTLARTVKETHNLCCGKKSTMFMDFSRFLLKESLLSLRGGEQLMGKSKNK